MKKVITGITVLIGCIVFITFLTIYNKKQSSNGFERILIDRKFQIKEVIELPTRSFMFAGTAERFIPLTTTLNLLNFYSVDSLLTEMDTLKFQYPSAFNVNAKNIYKNVLPPYYFATNPYGDIAVFSNRDTLDYKITNFRFDFFHAISPNTIIVRARYHSKFGENRSLAKLKLGNPVQIEREYPLPDIPNGLFANDGIIHYNGANKVFFYMYFYRGELLKLDTNLNMIYQAKTIDTVTHTEVKTRIFKSKSINDRPLKQKSPVSPLKFVNYTMASDSTSIYIHSKLRADNDDPQAYKENQIVDVYNIKTGKYNHSFNIPKYKNRQFDQFQVVGKSIVAVYRPYIIRYKTL